MILSGVCNTRKQGFHWGKSMEEILGCSKTFVVAWELADGILRVFYNAKPEFLPDFYLSLLCFFFFKIYAYCIDKLMNFNVILIWSICMLY